MKKIMFNDRYGLTDAVLQGRKTMTRRLADPKEEFPEILAHIDDDGKCDYLIGFNREHPDGVAILPKYEVGEVVAVAQCYSVVKKEFPHYDQLNCFRSSAAWNNKMFVLPDLMPHTIRFIGYRIERLQDISDEDCLREGVELSYLGNPGYGFNGYFVEGILTKHGAEKTFRTPREAFATLIDKVSGKGTWQHNPWVFVYEFKLVK